MLPSLTVAAMAAAAPANPVSICEEGPCRRGAEERHRRQRKWSRTVTRIWEGEERRRKCLKLEPQLRRARPTHSAARDRV